MQRMSIGQEFAGQDEVQRAIHAAATDGRQEHHQRKQDDPADDEGHDDAPEAVVGGTPEAVALQQKGREKSRHDVEDGHAEDMDQPDRKIERRGELRRLVGPAADGRISHVAWR